MKSLVVMSDERGPLMIVVRGDHELHEAKLRRIVGEFRMATPDEVEASQGVPPGFVGPVGAAMPVLGDETLRGGVLRSGANKADYHLTGIAADHVVGEYHDLRVVHAGDRCPECGHALDGERVIEVGQHLPARHQVLDADGRHAISTRTGPSTTSSWAATASAWRASPPPRSSSTTTSDGIVWPAAIAPFQVHLLSVRTSDETQSTLAERLYAELSDHGPRSALRRPRALAGHQVQGRRPARLSGADRRRQARRRGCRRAQDTRERRAPRRGRRRTSGGRHGGARRPLQTAPASPAPKAARAKPAVRCLDWQQIEPHGLKLQPDSGDNV